MKLPNTYLFNGAAAVSLVMHQHRKEVQKQTEEILVNNQVSEQFNFFLNYFDICSRDQQGRVWAQLSGAEKRKLLAAHFCELNSQQLVTTPSSIKYKLWALYSLEYCAMFFLLSLGLMLISFNLMSIFDYTLPILSFTIVLNLISVGIYWGYKNLSKKVEAKINQLLDLIPLT